MNTDKFFNMLEELRTRDPGAVAKLRRSLAADPGTDPLAYPVIEPWVQHLNAPARAAAYLVAGLWAAYGKKRDGKRLPLAEAFRQVPSSSGEARFIALLDADDDELPWRLRQAVSLAGKDVPLDWAALLHDVIRWGAATKFIQQRWARTYYQSVSTETDTSTQEQA